MKKKNIINDLNKEKKIISQIALREGKTVEEIRSEMKLAIQCALMNPDPAIQSILKSIPCNGEYPEPEEVISWAAIKIQKDISLTTNLNVIPLRKKTTSRFVF